MRLDTLARVLATTSAPAVVVAAVVHGELLGLDAFPPVSGLVARAAVRLTLIERGLDPRSLVIVEAGHRERAAEYAETLAGYRSGTPAGSRSGCSTRRQRPWPGRAKPSRSARRMTRG